MGSYLLTRCKGFRRQPLSLLCSTLNTRRTFSSSGDDNTCKEVEQGGPYSSRLKSRAVVRFDGPDTFHFLQGILSNDIKKLEQEQQVSLPTPNRPVVHSRPVYTAFLNAQGKFLYDAFFYRPPLSENRLDPSGSRPGQSASRVLVCDVDSSVLDDFFKHLKKHRLRAKVEFEDVSKDLSTWQRYGGSLLHDQDPNLKSPGWGAGSDVSEQAASEADREGYSWFRDPRNAALGFRGIFPTDTLPPFVEAGKDVDEVYYLMLRLDLGIPEGCTEIPRERANPLEYNLAWLNAISFEKGCYIGQELMARTQHRGVIRKRLMPISFVSESGEAIKEVVPGVEVIDTDTQKKVGDVTTVLGSRGLGVIRLEVAQKDPTKLILKDLNNVHVQLNMPKWWPGNWCPEELQEKYSF